MRGSKSNLALWTLQVLLALFFGLGSGLPKFLIPIDQLPMPVPLSQAFVWFIGTCEVLGALGLILPGISRIGRGLTPVAAVCLVALTICAAGAQLMGGAPGNAAFALAIGALAAVVAYGRRRLLPSRPAAVPAI
jgi:uncharacterized membrane protein